MAFGLVETGLISMALRPSTSPTSASATSLASFARNRAWVGYEKSGAVGSAPDCACSMIAFRLPGFGLVGDVACTGSVIWTPAADPFKGS